MLALNRRLETYVADDDAEHRASSTVGDQTSCDSIASALSTDVWSCAHKSASQWVQAVVVAMCVGVSEFAALKAAAPLACASEAAARRLLLPVLLLVLAETPQLSDRHFPVPSIDGMSSEPSTTSVDFPRPCDHEVCRCPHANRGSSAEIGAGSCVTSAVRSMLSLCVQTVFQEASSGGDALEAAALLLDAMDGLRKVPLVVLRVWMLEVRRLPESSDRHSATRCALAGSCVDVTARARRLPRPCSCLGGARQLPGRRGCCAALWKAGDCHLVHRAVVPGPRPGRVP